MADLLVKLYERRAEPETCAGNIRIFRPLPPDRTAVVDFVRRTFGEKWASECETAFFGFPVRMWIAADGGKVVGFACYDCTARGFFGPTGVLPGYRGRGIGKNLLLRCLEGLREAGYAYAVIGGVEEKNFAFYAKVCGAEPIPGSERGIYRDLL